MLSLITVQLVPLSKHLCDEHDSWVRVHLRPSIHPLLPPRRQHQIRARLP
jgi:hypothetical protein